MKLKGEPLGFVQVQVQVYFHTIRQYNIDDVTYVYIQTALC